MHVLLDLYEIKQSAPPCSDADCFNVIYVSRLILTLANLRLDVIGKHAY